MANLPVPSPRTFGVNEIETGGFLNSLRDALLFLLNPPMAVVYQTTVQSLTSGVAAAVSFDTTTVDTYGMHSNSTNNSRATAVVAGWYLITATIQYANTSAAHNRNVTINKNGVQVPQFGVAGLSGDTGVFPMVSAGAWVFLNAGDYVEVIAYQDSGGAVNTHTLGSSLSIGWYHA